MLLKLFSERKINTKQNQRKNLMLTTEQFLQQFTQPTIHIWIRFVSNESGTAWQSRVISKTFLIQRKSESWTVQYFIPDLRFFFLLIFYQITRQSDISLQSLKLQQSKECKKRDNDDPYYYSGKNTDRGVCGGVCGDVCGVQNSVWSVLQTFSPKLANEL